jgi:DNA-directed RNA polymerase subunit K/omega
MLVGYRALQIAQDETPRVPCNDSDTPLEIAQREFSSKCLPSISVLRYLPDGSIVKKHVNDLYAQWPSPV